MSVPALERGIAILRLFRRDRTTIAASEIAAELGLARSSLHALLAALTQLGLLRRLSSGHFALDAGVLAIGFEYLGSLPITELAAGVLERLRDETGWSTHLAILQGRSILYLSRFGSRHVLTRNVTVGSLLPAHTTALGRVMLCDLEPEVLRTMYADDLLGGAKAFAQFAATLRDDRVRGFVAGPGYHEPSIQVVAAPVRDASLRVVAAINAVAVEQPDNDLAIITRAVVTAAHELSRMLGAPHVLPNMHEPFLEKQL